jgi:hypothetical protein
LDLIYKKTGVRYHKYIFTDCYTNGDSNLKYHKKGFVNTVSKEDKKKFKKE